MTRIQSLGLALLATCAFGALVTTAAQAIEAPYWGVESKRLATGETREVVAKSISEYTFLAGALEFTCGSTSIAPGGTINGSNAGSPGTSREIIRFTNCAVLENGVCEIGHNGNREIVTAKLKDELVYDVKGGNSSSLAVEFTPESGPILGKVTLVGAGCSPVAAGVTTIEGQIAAQAFGGTSLGTKFLLELGIAPVLALTQYLVFPGTRITTILLDENGTATQKTLSFAIAGKAARLVGESEVKLASGKLWCVIL